MLFYQMTRLTKEKGALAHDDVLDAVAMGVKYFQDILAKDQDSAEKDYQDSLLDKELRDFMNLALGNKNGQNGWTQLTGFQR